MRKIREEIGVRTVLNTAEKLVNFSDADKLMMGAFHRTAIQKMHPVFQHLTYKEVFIVQGWKARKTYRSTEAALCLR